MGRIGFLTASFIHVRSTPSFKKSFTKPGSRAVIWACSLGETASGVVKSSGCEGELWVGGNRAWFKTAIQMGMVLDSESGKRLPRRVESTIMALLCEAYH